MEQNNSTKKRLSWGTGLTVAIVLFMIATLSMVFFAVSLDYHMVADDYYQQAEQYQQHINRVEEAGSLENPLQIEYQSSSQAIHLQFPVSGLTDPVTGSLENPLQIEYQSSSQAIHLQFPVSGLTDPVTGSVELYRPNDSSLDRSFELKPDENGIQQIPVANFARGRWLVKVNWSSGDRDFFEEASLFF
ncbi:MAG: hypothetical protein GVY02_03130 [Bacteroidetes bacterium]|jgi:hypothetical protein|nr:hypothetical protein [Bacteroidota bacterium]